MSLANIYIPLQLSAAERANVYARVEKFVFERGRIYTVAFFFILLSGSRLAKEMLLEFRYTYGFIQRVQFKIAQRQIQLDICIDKSLWDYIPNYAVLTIFLQLDLF